LSDLTYESKDGDDGKELAGLEVLRFLSALAVVFWHYGHFFVMGIWPDTNGPDRSLFPLHSVLFLLYDYGFYAVNMFWTISGFIFFWKYSHPIFEKVVGLRTFFFLRFSRLYPLHVATLVIVLVLQFAYSWSHETTFIYGSNDAIRFILHIFMASDWPVNQRYSFNGPFWSVSVEVLVYFLFFVYVCYLRPSLVTCVIAIIALKVITRSGYLAYFLSSDLTLCAQYFFIGGFVQQLLLKIATKDWNKPVFYGSLLICSAVIVAWTYWGIERTDRTVQIFSAALVAAFVTVVMPKGLLSKVAPLGNLTYSSYLLHFPIQLTAVLVIDSLQIGRGLFYSPAALMTFLAVTFIAAHWAYHYLERPAQSLIRRLTIQPQGVVTRKRAVAPKSESSSGEA
jgi:peptidoglycan/LPS O-acetylase OafA/YrhL